MANYSLVINSQFKPFSYQEMLAPTLMATQAHQELENQYGELSAKANVWEEMANEQTDPYAYKMYKTYANDLEAQAGQLAREGLNAASRRDMLNMRARYSKEITPIEAAYKRREELASEQRKVSLNNPTMFYQRNASAMSLDDFIKNPSIDYGEKYSGALLAQQVGQMAANLKTALTGKGKLKGIGLPYQYEQLLQYGYTPQQIQQAITNPQEGNPVLNTIVEQALAASGMKNWASPKQLSQARAYANQGLYNAIGKTEFKNFTDSFSMQDELAKRREEREAERRKQAQPNGLALNPTNIYSSREQSAEEKKYNDAIRNYSKYFYKENGKWKMTYEGWKEYNKKVQVTSGKSEITPEGTTVLTGVKPTYSDSPFKKFMNSLGIKNISSKSFGDWQRNTAGEFWGKYSETSPAAKTAIYDATKTTEYIYDVPASKEYQNNFKSKLSRVIGSNEKFEEVDYDAKSNKWIPTGKTLSFSDFNTEDYNLVARAPSEIGTTWFIRKDGEKAKRYLAVPGVHITAEGGRDQAISEMLMTQRILQNPNLTPQQRKKLEGHYDNLTQQQIMFESQLDLTNQTNSQSINPYYIP